MNTWAISQREARDVRRRKPERQREMETLYDVFEVLGHRHPFPLDTKFTSIRNARDIIALGFSLSIVELSLMRVSPRTS